MLADRREFLGMALAVGALDPLMDRSGTPAWIPEWPETVVRALDSRGYVARTEAEAVPGRVMLTRYRGQTYGSAFDGPELQARLALEDRLR